MTFPAAAQCPIDAMQGAARAGQGCAAASRDARGNDLVLERHPEPGRLERHPWIRRATVRREFPRRVMVEVAERQPAAVVLIDQLYYVDRSGTVVALVGRDDTLDLPFVTGIEAAVLAGERPFPRHAIRQALKLLQSMRAEGLSRCCLTGSKLNGSRGSRYSRSRRVWRWSSVGIGFH